VTTQPDTQAVRDCARRYPAIGQVQDVQPFGAAQSHTGAYRVRTDNGSFVLQVLSTHPYGATESRLDYICSVMEKVIALGVQAPLPIRNDQGRRLTPFGRYFAVLSAHIEGAPFERDNVKHHAAAGTFLGMFHKATSDFTPRGTSWVGKLDADVVLDGALLKSLPATAQGEALRQSWDGLLSRSRQISDELAAQGYSRLPAAVLHSEYVAKHLRMKDNAVCALLDFEYTYREARALDVAIAMEDLPCSARGRMDFDYAKVRTFLRAYDSAGAPLQPGELASFPALLRALHFASLGFLVMWVLKVGNRPSDLDVKGRMARDLARIDWWHAHGSEFVARAAEAAE
jgi:Ser/Thr protein kinase RdoA (MazF antagonist)